MAGDCGHGWGYHFEGASGPCYACKGDPMGNTVPFVAHTHDEAEPSVVVAQISGYISEGRHETTVHNNAPSKVKVTLEHEGDETFIIIEEIEE